MNIALVQFPGSNCERETSLAVQRAGMRPVEFLWNEAPSKLQELDAYILVGGFSYEDRSRAGIIAAMDPLMEELKIQSEQGKPILGICNGAQILVEAGLVPGLKNNQLGMALTENKRVCDGKILGTGFYNSWIYMRPNAMLTPNAFTRHLSKDSVLSVPIAHAEGRFVMPIELLEEIEAEGLSVFQYCDEKGNVTHDFPINPNGSVHNIAAVMNKAGTVMAMMPHPERTLAGDPIFLSIKDYLFEKKIAMPTCRGLLTAPMDPADKPREVGMERGLGMEQEVEFGLKFQPVVEKITQYVKKANEQELLVKLTIADNQALTVKNTLKKLGFPAKINRMVHWKINCKSPEVLEQIKQTGVLYNDQKEYLVPSEQVCTSSNRAFLVQAKEDLIGQQKLQMLQDHFGIDGVESICYGVLWIFDTEEIMISDLINSITATHIFFNPNSHVCYEYEN
jgi:phosphoribosylformylglycinamidine synthase